MVAVTTIQKSLVACAQPRLTGVACATPGGATLDENPSVEGSDSSYDACPRPFVLKPRGQGISSSNGGSSSAGNVGSDCCAGRTGCAMMLFTRLPRNGTFWPLRTIVRPTQPFVSSPKTSAKRS